MACLAAAVSGCAASSVRTPPVPASYGRRPVVVVLPVQNLSRTDAPLKGIRQSFEDRLRKLGLRVVPEDVVEQVMARHRMRDVGGLNAEMSLAFSKEAGAGAVLITSLELYDPTYPPKLALTARLVATGSDEPEILWMDSTGVSGDDKPGLLDLGIVRDPGRLLEKAVGYLAGSLDDALSGRWTKGNGVLMAGRFKPNRFFRSPLLDPGRRYTVVVAPFYNVSHRSEAGNIMMLHFVEELCRHRRHFRVIEPGLIRHEFLNERIIMNDGISFANADALFSQLRADLIVTGKVLDYQDYKGPDGNPSVDFDTLAIEDNSHEVVWSSSDSATGKKGVYFFDRGRISTAHRMASAMARSVVELMIKG
ncbi:MAG: hypothetical protein M0Z48_04840 [Nitrospiraceae bacterium]|nr:hypothetical protein [Nitrospiraceae bacterium]